MQTARGASLNASEDAAAESTKDTSPSRRVWPILVGVSLIAYTTDVVTKILAVKHLEPFETRPIFGDIFGLHLTRNPGAAFSTGTSATEALSVLAIIALCVVLYLWRRVGSPLWAFAFGLLTAGIAGNLTDRLLRAPGPLQGHVVDMFRFPNWPIFNVADICINVAAGLIIVQAFRGIRLDGTREGSDD